MMADAQYTNPYVEVIMADGSTWSAQTYNPDMIRYERTARKHDWPGPSKEPFAFITFLAWSAGRREGHIPTSLSWEDFADRECLQVSSPNATAVPPTEAATVPDTA
jgi:hypothetical protein